MAVEGDSVAADLVALFQGLAGGPVYNETARGHRTTHDYFGGGFWVLCKRREVELVK